MTLTMACAGFVYAGVTITMPKVFEMGLGDTGFGDGLGLSYTEIGLFVGIVSGVASTSGILGGWLADRFSARSIYLVCWMLQVPLLLVVTSVTGVSLLVVALLVLSCNLSFVAAENMLVAQYTPVRWRSLAYGAKFVLALGVSGVTVMLAGWVFDTRGNFELLYTGLGAAAIIAAVAATLLPGRRKTRSGADTRSAGADRRSEPATRSVVLVLHRLATATANRGNRRTGESGEVARLLRYRPVENARQGPRGTPLEGSA